MSVRPEPAAAEFLAAAAGPWGELEADRPRHARSRRVRAFRTNRVASAGLIAIVAISLFCFVGPLVYATDQVHTDLGAANLPPSGDHPLGTDPVGYDVLGRLMVGGQTSLLVGLCAGLLATLLGAAWGSIAGYAGGWLDAVMMRLVDAWMSLPALLLLMVLAAIVTPSAPMLVVAIALVAWLSPARLMRGEALSLRAREYVQAVRMMGGGSGRAIGRHILPNAVGTLVVTTTFQVAEGVLAVAYLSYFGLGIPPPSADWGGMLTNGLQAIDQGYWWQLYPPGVAIVVLVASLYFVADGLNDAFAVRSRSD